MFLSILLLTSTVAAEDIGQFTFIDQGGTAPFAGVLFDEQATAEILAIRENAQMECQLQTQYELERQAAEYDLEIENLNIRHDTLQKEYDTTVEQKDLEIEQLQKTLEKHTPQNKWLWFSAGVVGGIALSYGAYEVFN